MANFLGALGSSTGGLIGAAVGGPFAPITGAIGSVIGSLFGGGGQHGPKKSEINISQSANNIAEFQSNFQQVAATVQTSTNEYTSAVGTVASQERASTLISVLASAVILVALIVRKK